MNWFWKIWKDPVWSKVIAVAIVFVGGKIWESVDVSSYNVFKNRLISILIANIIIPVWIGIVALLVLWALFVFIKNWKKRRAVPIRNLAWDTQIGDYTFEELYNKLNQKLRVRTSKMDSSGIAPPDTLIVTQFKEHYEKFKKGISGGETLMLRAMGELNMNDGGYIVDVLAPKLSEYGLLTETKGEHILSGKSYLIVTYKISDLGYHFYDCLQEIHSLTPQSIYRADQI